MPRQQRRVSFTTLLIVGEGSDDKAFIDHVKSLFHQRHSGRKITVKAGDGGSPGNIITHASRSYKNEDYNQRLHPRLAGHHTKPESYAVLFTQPVLAATQNTSVAAVRDLLQGH